MIELQDTADYVVMILVASGVGAIGGFASELLLERSENTGTIELPGRIKGTRFLDLGFPASLLVGAIAAAAILYFFPPTTETVTPGGLDELPTTTVEYDLIKLVALSLIVGSAGPRFLAATQARVLAALNEQRVGSAVTTGTSQVERLAASAKAAIPAAIAGAFAQRLPDADAQLVDELSNDAATALEQTIQPQVMAAQSAIESAGQAAVPQAPVTPGPASEVG